MNINFLGYQKPATSKFITYLAIEPGVDPFPWVFQQGARFGEDTLVRSTKQVETDLKATAMVLSRLPFFTGSVFRQSAMSSDGPYAGQPIGPVNSYFLPIKPQHVKYLSQAPGQLFEFARKPGITFSGAPMLAPLPLLTIYESLFIIF